MKVTYSIDVADWSSGHEDRERAEEALGQWFEGLAFKSQLAILYAYRLAEENEGTFPDGCPWVEMVRDAERRILNEKAPWVNESGATGFNLFLDPVDVDLENPKKKKTLTVLRSRSGNPMIGLGYEKEVEG